MKVELMSPLKEDATIRITYNDKEIFSKEYKAGETPKVEIETPDEPGVAKTTLIIGDKEIPMGTCTYS